MIMKTLSSRFLSVLLLCCLFESSFFMINALVVVGLSACHPSQIHALKQFKIEFDSHGCNQTNYLSGVRCDNTTGLLAELQIPKGCLSGTLNPNSSLFSFHHLRYLELSDNDFFSSSLPSGFGNLNRLEILKLSSNGFQGQIPSSFSNLSMLSYLDLSQNDLTGSFSPIKNLTNLSVIHLSSNNFFGVFPSYLFTMPLLSFLGLAMNKLTDPIEVSNSSLSTRLEVLSLRGNNFQGQILKPISKLIRVTHLELSFLNISYPIDLSFLSSLRYLTHLDLSGNSVSPTSLTSGIPLSMEFLVLSDCNITEFPNVLKTFQNLTFIDISSNGIKGKVPAWLWSLPNLISVVISNNSFNSFEGPLDILVNSSVEMLYLQSNSFEGALPNLPLSINVFFAGTNSFTGEIPLSICNRSSFAVLDLSYNNFTGPIPQCLTNLMTLRLRKNSLEGSIPDAFYANASLRTFDVGYNRLTGKLPRSLLNCSSLQFLSIDNNRIEDTFPFWLKALPNLKVLILRSNKLYGPISPPDESPLAFLELRIFEISNNSFSGSLSPNYFVEWKATSIDHINEDGSIYMSYGTKATRDASYSYEDLIDLQYKGLHMEQKMVFDSYSAIDFSGNRLEGQIPESIGLLKTLIALNLSNNAFTGHIPLSLENVTALQSLDFSRNQLSGTIPNGLKSLSFLAYINMSHNQLTGEIPQGTQITGQPKSSFEGNAQLCGLPLEEICYGTDAPPIQQQEEEQVLSWEGVAVGYGMGVLLGWFIVEVIASYKPEWLAKIVCVNKRKN